MEDLANKNDLISASRYLKNYRKVDNYITSIFNFTLPLYIMDYIFSQHYTDLMFHCGRIQGRRAEDFRNNHSKDSDFHGFQIIIRKSYTTSKYNIHICLGYEILECKLDEISIELLDNYYTMLKRDENIDKLLN